MPSATEMRECPFCLTEVPKAAKKCRHCGEWLDGKPEEVAGPAVAASTSPEQEMVACPSCWTTYEAWSNCCPKCQAGNPLKADPSMEDGPVALEPAGGVSIGLAIVSLLFGTLAVPLAFVPLIGLAAVIPAVLGLIFGLIAFLINKTQDQKATLSLAALVVSVVALVIFGLQVAGWASMAH